MRWSTLPPSWTRAETDNLSVVVAAAGDKLRILGAEISAGGQQSEALEAAKTTFLRIHCNGTHRYETMTVVALVVSTQMLGNVQDLV